MDWIVGLAPWALGALGIGGLLWVSAHKKITPEQLEAVEKWLLYAVLEAEKALGKGTGTFKLSRVYGEFVSLFQGLVPILPIGMFGDMVDQALVMMNAEKEKREVKEYIEG